MSFSVKSSSFTIYSPLNSRIKSISSQSTKSLADCEQDRNTQSLLIFPKLNIPVMNNQEITPIKKRKPTIEDLKSV